MGEVPFDDEAYRRETGAPALHGEPGYSTLERLWTRPTLEVNELRGGGAFWYAFRRHRNKLYKVYLGRSADLTHARLLAVAQQLAEKAGA